MREQLKHYQLTNISKWEFCRCFSHSRRESRLDQEDEASGISSNITFHFIPSSVNNRCRLAMKTSYAKHTNIKYTACPSRSPRCMMTTALRPKNIGTVTGGHRLSADGQDMIQESPSTRFINLMAKLTDVGRVLDLEDSSRAPRLQYSAPFHPE